MFEAYIKADGPLETAIMATLNELLARLDASGAKAEAERAQVFEAISALKTEITSLREIIQNQPLPDVDLAPAFAKLDEIDAKIDGIYTPEDSPAPPAGTGE